MKVLVIEHEAKVALLIAHELTSNGFAVEVIEKGLVGFEMIMLGKNEYDLVLMETKLADSSGIDICRQIRSAGNSIPIILISTVKSITEEVVSLDSGADDYISKPFNFSELTARIRTILRRPQTICMTLYKVKNLTLNLGLHKVFKNGIEILLTLKEFLILEYLLRNKGIALSRDQIISHAWDINSFPASNVVDVHIASLNKKLANGKNKYIESIRGFGYRFVK